MKSRDDEYRETRAKFIEDDHAVRADYVRILRHHLMIPFHHANKIVMNWEQQKVLGNLLNDIACLPPTEPCTNESLRAVLAVLVQQVHNAETGL